MRKPSKDLVCARICLNSILIHFGVNDGVDSLLNEVNEGKITPIQAIEKGMELHLKLAREVRPRPQGSYAAIFGNYIDDSLF
jgi:hypothetical protein